MLTTISSPPTPAHVIGPFDLTASATFDLSGNVLAGNPDVPRYVFEVGDEQRAEDTYEPRADGALKMMGGALGRAETRKKTGHVEGRRLIFAAEHLWPWRYNAAEGRWEKATNKGGGRVVEIRQALRLTGLAEKHGGIDIVEVTRRARLQEELSVTHADTSG